MNEFFNSKFVKDIQTTGKLPAVEVEIKQESIITLALAALFVVSVSLILYKISTK